MNSWVEEKIHHHKFTVKAQKFLRKPQWSKEKTQLWEFCDSPQQNFTLFSSPATHSTSKALIIPWKWKKLL
jgi:hypothetical protein